MLTADNICNQPNWTTQEWVWPHSAENPRIWASCWLGVGGVTQPYCGLSASHTKTIHRKLAPSTAAAKLREGLLEWRSGNISRPNASPTLLQLQRHRCRNVGPVALPGGHFLYSSNKSRWKPNGEERNPLHCAREMPRHNEMSRIQGPRERRQI